MAAPAYAVGQAVYIRTNTPDYSEETIPFTSLEELVRVCSTAHANLTLDKIIVYAMVNGEPCAITLSFVSAVRGGHPGSTEYASH